MAALGLALVLAAGVGAYAVSAAKRAGDEVQVTGSARRPIRSDYIVWRASVTAQHPTLQGAYAELEQHSDRVRAFLKQSGVADSLLAERAIESTTIPEVAEYGRETGRILGYRLTQWFEVRSADVEGVGVVAQRANTLLNEGVPLVSMPPEYLFTRLAEIRTTMLAEATKDAKERAEAISRSAGSRIGSVRSARMGVFQITPRNSTEVSDYGINDTSSLEKDITAVVRVTFAVE